MKPECLHQEARWRLREKCEICRYRGALEKIAMMGIVYSSTFKPGSAADRMYDVAGEALYPDPKDTD